MTKAGIRLEVLLNATTRRDEQGDVIGVVGIGQDVGRASMLCVDRTNIITSHIHYPKDNCSPCPRT